MTNTFCDAVVVGAGLGGIYQTYKLRESGLETICVEKAPEVGGTWYWNHYPGAMSDTESHLYRYSWDKEDLLSYPWKGRYLYQPEILKYVNHVVDRHHLRNHIRLNTLMKAATWLEKERRWRVECGRGDVITARYLINALGLLSTPNYPKIPGLHSFSGDLIHTASWPDIDLSSKCVGVIGNGSTGIQIMTALAPGVKRLVSFQRNPQYSVPSGQEPVTKEYRDWINKNYDSIYDGVWKSKHGHGIVEVTRPAMSVSADERQKIFQECWDKGNAFRFMFSTFGDLTTSVEANKEACKFIHSKIDEIVKDPAKADALKPTELYARRPLCDTGYYQIFNRENVDVVSLRKNPIKEIVPTGIKLSDDTLVELDALVLATGFDALEGSYLRVSITGQGGQTLKDHWRSGPTTYAGVACAGFPNMFLISGPQGPFANFPCAIESEVNFVTNCIAHAEKLARNASLAVPPYITVKPSAEQDWVTLCDELTEGSLFKTTKSWIFGENVEGRKPRVQFYFSGLAPYIEHTKQESQAGFPSFHVDSARVNDNTKTVKDSEMRVLREEATARM
jgi:cation diffusion facilitator CzcD-associated flavoprotein CzcO